jgi:hypothetical protein
VPGLIYCALQSTHFFHIKAKMYELKHRKRLLIENREPPL